MNKKYDSIIFDLDGTLWNTLTACTNGWNDGLRSLGISKRITTNDLKKVVGNPWNICAEILFPDLIIKHTNLFKTLDDYEQEFIKQSQIQKSFQDHDCFGISKKPKSEMINDMAKKYTLLKPVYIGDTAGDQNAAKSTGINFIHATWGYGKVEKECLSFDSFTELTDYFRE